MLVLINFVGEVLMASEKHFVIVGGGTAGWMAANLLAQRFGPHAVSKGRASARISVVEAPDIGIIGVGEGSTPQLKAFFDQLGIAETSWMPRCNATYKNGISFHGWSHKPGYDSYFHPFPATIDSHTAPAFYLNSHYRRQGFDLDANPDRFFLSAYLAAQHKAPIAAENFPFEMAYGYHFDAYLVGAMLRDHAISLGVKHIEGKVVGVQRGESGDISAINLADNGNGPLIGDFFIDCTGFKSLLLQETLGVSFISFANNLFNDSAVVMPTATDEAFTRSETRATALSAGWAWSIPLTNRTGNGYVYSSKYLDKDAAELELRTHLGLLDSDVEARHLSMKVGRVAETWSGNCLAVGLSQGFIEPLEATALHLVQATVENFIDALEADNFGPGQRAQFNQNIAARFEGVRDYIVCHYKASARRDTAYWRDCSAIEHISEALYGMLSTWSNGGDLKQEHQRLNIGAYYPLTSWIALLGGYGHYPHTAQLQAPPAELQQFDLAEISEFIRRCGLNFSDHKAFLNA